MALATNQEQTELNKSFLAVQQQKEQVDEKLKVILELKSQLDNKVTELADLKKSLSAGEKAVDNLITDKNNLIAKLEKAQSKLSNKYQTLDTQFKENNIALAQVTTSKSGRYCKAQKKAKKEEKAIQKLSMGNTFEKDIFPYIGKRSIAVTKPLELFDALRKMAKRGALEKMRKIRQRYDEVFYYAIIYSPAPDLASALIPPKKQHFPFLTIEELPYFLKDLAGHTGNIITKTILLTAVRTQEFRFARWQDIDLEKGNYAQYLEGRRKMMQWYADYLYR